MTTLNPNSILDNYGGLEKNCLANLMNAGHSESDQNDSNKFYDLLKSSPYYDIDSFKTAFKPNSFSIFSSNVESIYTSIDHIKILVDDLATNSLKLSVMCFQECWISENSDVNSIQITGYNCYITRQSCGRKGGLVTYVSTDLISEELKLEVNHSKIWECQGVAISGSRIQKPVLCLNVYRPPRRDQFNPFKEDLYKILSKIHNTGHEFILNGDFNLNLLKFDEDADVNDFYSNICSFGLYPKITLPTRFASKSASLIDNTFCRLSTTSLQSESGILIHKFSDHQPYFTLLHDFYQKPETRNPKRITITVQPSDDVLMQKLNEANIRENLTSEDPNENLSRLVNIIQSTKENLSYTKQVKFKKYKHKLNPWMTDAIMKSIAYKDTLYKEKCASLPSLQKDMITNLKTYQEILRKTIRSAKKQYYDDLFALHQNDIKQTWTCINEILGRNTKKENLPEYFTDDHAKFEDPSAIADKFNHYFANIGHEFAAKLPYSKNGYQKYLDNFSYQGHDTFKFNEIDCDEIEKIIDGLKPKSSSGIDGISSKSLKSLKTVISSPLAYIINQCIQQNIFPDSLKIAKVIPIYKKDDHKLFANYRPISLLPSLSKIFERVLYNQLFEHFSTNNLFFSSQYGFRSNHSTEFAAIELTERIKQELHKKSIPLTIFLDLSKAFDTLNHEIIIWKLSKYGLHTNALELIQNYFSNRKQYVDYHGTSSHMSPLSIGVPQGSILGPLFFIVYMNDIANSSELFKFIIYADDTSLFTTSKDTNLINKELEKVYVWLCENRLSLNVSKTKCMVFNQSVDICSNYKLSINKNEIDLVNSFKFLGIHLDKQLNWKIHKSFISKKMLSVIGVMNRMKFFLPIHVKKKIYLSLINCHLNFGNLLWSNAPSDILKLQKKAVRLILCRKYNAHTDPLFKILNLPKIQDIVTLARLKFFNQHKLKKLPYFLQSLEFPLNSAIHEHDTRRNNSFHKVHCHKSSLIKVIPDTIELLPSTVHRKITHPEYYYSSSSLINQLRSLLIDNYSSIEFHANDKNCYSCHGQI